jgi:hypothetical protein
VNFRVADPYALLAVLREAECRVRDKVEESEYGKFGWVMDPEGNKIELCGPPGGVWAPAPRWPRKTRPRGG